MYINYLHNMFWTGIKLWQISFIKTNLNKLIFVSMLHADITTSLSTSVDNGAIFSTKYKSVGLCSP